MGPEHSEACDYEIITPNGRKVSPPESRCWCYSKDKFQELLRDNRIWFGKNGKGVPRIKRFLSEVKSGAVSKTIWTRSEVNDNQKAKREVKDFNSQDVFSTPKPEKLVERISLLASQKGDLVLDSFLGSGTTAAVAHKMGRRYIGIELGDHCDTHCVPRLKKVCDGTDQGGVSKAVNWKGGGGFRYYYLAPSILEKDSFGNWVINKNYNANMLAAAMAKHEGFTYCPDEEIYWKQGKSTEEDYIFTTTEFLTAEHVEVIASQMKETESLLICCKAFTVDQKRFPNITIKKIPNMLLGRCEFGRDDYSFNIVTMPRDENEPDFVPQGPGETKNKRKNKKKNGQMNIFEGGDS